MACNSFYWILQKTKGILYDCTQLSGGNLIDYRLGVTSIPAGIHVFKVNNRNNRTRCEICSELTIKTLKRRQYRRSPVFIVNFENISHLLLVNFEQVNDGGIISVKIDTNGKIDVSIWWDWKEINDVRGWKMVTS